MEGSEKSLGAFHPQTLKALSQLARLVRDRLRLDEAEVLMLRNARGCERAFGLLDSNTQQVLAEVAVFLMDIQKAPDEILDGESFERGCKFCARYAGLRDSCCDGSAL